MRLKIKKTKPNPSDFTDKGIKALFNWAKEKKVDCDDFTEYENISEFHKDYMIEDYPTHAHINDRTVLITVGTGPEDKGFIIKDLKEEKRNFTKREC